MAQCGWCGKAGVMLAVDGHGRCRECEADAGQRIDAVRTAIDAAERELAGTYDPARRLSLCRRIVQHAEELLPLEEKGVATLEDAPSRIAGRYRRRHDLFVIEHASGNLRGTLARIRTELKPYQSMYVLEGALGKMREAQRLVGEVRRRTVAAVINQKGGVGKTTATVNLGIGLGMLGRRVLLIDLDPQANLTEAMGINGDDCQHTIFDVLRGGVDIPGAVIRCGGVDVIPANVLLARTEQDFANTDGNQFLLRRALSDLDDYDFILIDCLPSLGLLSLNALMAARELYVPLLPEYFALSGMRKLMDAIEFAEERGRHDIRISTVIFSRVNGRKKHHRAVIDKIQGHFGADVDYFYIRESIALAEALGAGQSIFAYQPLSHGAVDYFLACKQIVSRQAAYSKVSGPAVEPSAEPAS